MSDSAWTPLRDKVFRGLWIGVLAGNVGTWMQTVGRSGWWSASRTP